MKYLIAVLCLVGAAGCGGPTGSEVAGTVTFIEGGPLPKGVVNLNGPGGSFRGSINPDGSYVLTGVADGDYKVTITGAMDGADDEGEDMNYDDDGNYIESEVVEPKSLISSIYSNLEESGLTLKVPGEYDLQVSKAE
jgi:hypothetical protein